MSSLILEIGYPDSIESHPYGDKLNIAKWRGWTCCVPTYITRETLMVYFQPDLLLTHELAETLGVSKYLKKLGKQYPKSDKWAGRVGVANLRGIASYGILTKARPEWLSHRDELASFLEVEKYDPPEKLIVGECEKESVFFSRYSKIEHLNNFPEWFNEASEVVVTEKIDGTNNRIGLCPETDVPSSYLLMAGSRTYRRRFGLHWKPL